MNATRSKHRSHNALLILLASLALAAATVHAQPHRGVDSRWCPQYQQMDALIEELSP